MPAEADTPLLYVLRNDLALNGARFGCGLTLCGACTVLIDGRAARSCVTEIGAIGDAEITTIENSAPSTSRTRCSGPSAPSRQSSAAIAICLGFRAGVTLAAKQFTSFGGRL